MTLRREIEFIRLFLFSQDTSASVIRKYVRLKLLADYNEDLVQYLNDDDSKHKFHHRWQNIPCCMCLPEGCRRLRKISHTVFQKFYDVDVKQNEIPGHQKNNGSHIKQLCIHTFIAKKNITLDSLDLYMLMCLLDNCMASLPQNEKEYLEEVKRIRNNICHSSSTNYSESDISTMWSGLEKTDEDDDDFDIACNNLTKLRWFAQLYKTISSKNIDLDTTPAVEYLLQTISSSIACGIEFKNLTNSNLQRPHCTVDQGLISNPPKSLSSRGNGFMLSHKHPRSFNGTSGVVSWEIENKGFRVAVMWFIPYTISYNKNTLAVGFVEQHTSDVFDNMYKSPSKDESQIIRAEYSRECSSISCIKENLEITGIMGNSQKTVISIELKEKESPSTDTLV